MPDILTAHEAAALITQGDTIMVGGFLRCGDPLDILNALALIGTNDLTIIANDAGKPNEGIGKFITNSQIRTMIVTYVGINPEASQKMCEGTLDVTLIPQGTFAERIRAGGAGLGGILTPTGVGTLVAEGKEHIVVDGKTYLLETALRANVALIKAHTADMAGNLVYRGAARNMNPLLATAADVVIVEVEHIVPIGDIEPDHVITPGIFVDYLVQSSMQV